MGCFLSEKSVATKLSFVDGFKFNVKYDVEGMPDLLVDEAEPVGEGSGPTPTRLLSTAVGHCLSSSLIFCLMKARIPVKKLETTVVANKFRNERGRLRIKSLDVQISLNIDLEDKSRVGRCLEIFENYCTVTQSIRQGIEVNVSVT